MGRISVWNEILFCLNEPFLHACRRRDIFWNHPCQVMGGQLIWLEHDFVILRQNDLKLGMHVHCHMARCSAQKNTQLIQKSRSHFKARSNAIKLIVFN